MALENEVLASQPTEFNVLSIIIDGFDTVLTVNLPVLIGLIVTIFLVLGIMKKIKVDGFNGFRVEEITVKDPFTGSQIKIKANTEDKKIAHRIWTELVTRKAALPFQRDKDVIVEVYDSWHSLFHCVREQIASVPVEKLRGREQADIEKLIDISTKVLNEGLRPHMTEWQAKYRSWYEFAKSIDGNKTRSPQEIQCDFPEYDQLVSSIEVVNANLKRFADELKKVVRSK